MKIGKNDYRAQHPSKQVSDCDAFWFGAEVEGMEQGAYTAFVASKLSFDAEMVIHRAPAELEQIFFTETFNNWEWLLTSHLMSTIRERGLFVTVGRMHDQVEAFLPIRETQPEFAWFRMIVRFFGHDWVRYLGRNDQISVGNPYELYTFHHGVLTLPEQYKNDKA